MRDLYLHITGPDIKGDAQDALNKDAIELESWSGSNGMAISGTRSAAGSATVGKPYFGDISISKMLDSSSIYIMKHIIAGTTFKELKLRQYRASEKGRILFLELTLGDCILSNYSISASEGIPYENVSINFGTILVNYADTDKATGLVGSPKKAGYSRIKNSKL